MGEIVTMKEYNILTDLRAKILEHEEELAKFRNEQDELNTQLSIATAQKDRKQQANLKESLKAVDYALRAVNSKLTQLRTSVSEFETQEKRANLEEATETNVVQAFESLNANFITSERKWHLIYSNGCRYDLEVKEVDDLTMRDMIHGETGFSQTNELTLKEIARRSTRSYRNVERTFNPPNPHVLNQMNELRKFWLQPIYGVKPHWAFDTLINTIAGNEPEYKDQLERIIAYRYVKPEDIFIPNPDSSAKGGAGRDTLFDILKIIFTNECVGEANHETFHGTHNGELWGKVWVIISDRDAKAVDYAAFKNLTGGRHFRLRKMNTDARQAPRTFTFFAAGNGINGSFPVLGTGGAGNEDRRVEPFISNANLSDALLAEPGVTPENLGDVIEGLQATVWKNEERIAEWLGYIIEKHDVKHINKLMPIHGKHYKTMCDRQKNVFKNFMERISDPQLTTNTYPVKDMYKLYQLTTGGKHGQDTFITSFAEWLTRKTGEEWGVGVKRYYESTELNAQEHRKQVIYNKAYDESLNQYDAGYVRRVFDVFEFTNQGVVDNYGNDLDGKIRPENIRDEYY